MELNEFIAMEVSDPGHDGIAVPDRDDLALLVSFRDDQLDAPHDVAFDRKGHLPITETDTHRIVRYFLEGLK